jgi:hypothetical protein
MSLPHQLAHTAARARSKIVLMVDQDSHSSVNDFYRLYPARRTWPAVRFLFAKAAEEASREKASNSFLKNMTIHTERAT